MTKSERKLRAAIEAALPTDPECSGCRRPWIIQPHSSECRVSDCDAVYDAVRPLQEEARRELQEAFGDNMALQESLEEAQARLAVAETERADLWRYCVTALTTEPAAPESRSDKASLQEDAGARVYHREFPKRAPGKETVADQGTPGSPGQPDLIAEARRLADSGWWVFPEPAHYESEVRVIRDTLRRLADYAEKLEAALSHEPWSRIPDVRAALKQGDHHGNLAERLAALDRELERWRHGETIESDAICPNELRAFEAERERKELRAENKILSRYDAALTDAINERDALAKQAAEWQRKCDDRDDWRAGVALIASALAYPHPDLSCAAIAEHALGLRAWAERAREALHDLPCSTEQADDALADYPGDKEEPTP